MKKRLFAILLLLVFVCSMCVTAYATTRAVSVYPALSFSGTTANCRVTITAAQQEIDATLQLWRGSNLIASWSESGTSYVAINGSHAVTSGRTYSVTVTGTIDGVPFSASTDSATCP